MNMVTVKSFNKNHIWIYSESCKSNWDLDWNNLGELDIYQKGGPSTLQNNMFPSPLGVMQFSTIS